MKALQSHVAQVRALLVFCALLLTGLSNNALADFRYKTANDAGKQYCGSAYPATKLHAKAKRNLLKGGCWSCPKDFKRTALPSPDKHKSCKKRRSYIDATYHSKATGVLKNVCKGDPWLKNKKCWTCPSGYKRSLKEKNGKAQCKPRKKYFYHEARYRGEAGCGKGKWSTLTSGKCFTCPKGYIRNPFRVTSDRTKDGKACMKYVKSKKKQASFIRKHKKQLTDELDRHPDLIKQAGRFQKKIAKTIKKKGIKNLTKSDIRKAGGVQLLADATCGKQYGSISITAGGDLSVVVGGNGSGGFAIGLVDECETGADGNDWVDQGTDFRMMWLATVNVSAGVSASADGSVEIGIWGPRYDELHGWANGIVLAGAYGYGASVSGWWGINWAGKKDEFIGVSIGPQVGYGGEAEWNFGYTFQNQTFNACKGVTVEATNKTGKKVKVIDVDYYDYRKELWRSEPTKNTKVNNNKKYTNRFNLNQVDYAHTQIRVEYRVKDGMGWSKVHKAWSSKAFCEEGKTYRVTLRSK